eukprot:9470001-Pyramimonas_sp.AAC.1
MEACGGRVDRFARKKYFGFCRRRGVEAKLDFSTSGPPHQPTFVCSTPLPINGDHKGVGTGANKKDAEFLACMDANNLLEELRVRASVTRNTE